MPTYVEHHRTLGDRVREIVGAGFVLRDLVEPEWPEDHERDLGPVEPAARPAVPRHRHLRRRQADGLKRVARRYDLPEQGQGYAEPVSAEPIPHLPEPCGRPEPYPATSSPIIPSRMSSDLSPSAPLGVELVDGVLVVVPLPHRGSSGHRRPACGRGCARMRPLGLKALSRGRRGDHPNATPGNPTWILLRRLRSTPLRLSTQRSARSLGRAAVRTGRPTATELIVLTEPFDLKLPIAEITP